MRKPFKSFLIFCLYIQKMYYICQTINNLNQNKMDYKFKENRFLDNLNETIIAGVKLNTIQKATLCRAFEKECSSSEFHSNFDNVSEFWEMPKFFIVKTNNKHAREEDEQYLYRTIIKGKSGMCSECSYSFENQMLISLQIICDAPRDFSILACRMLQIEK